ncbi:hypothetical protein JCM10908_000091 [Rhodotorula pacifica]|uniref:zinc finger MYND domain-containing protein n=1 Tax=Rhodotorula pacifica TaxID=1495444 RepID=UPI00316EE06D
MTAPEPVIYCLVCAQPTRNTCSVCRKHGVDLGFCSPAHQRIAWSEHKKVCGVNANPFRWPLLSASEADEAIAHVNYRVIDEDIPDFPSLSEVFQREFYVPSHRVVASPLRHAPSGFLFVALTVSAQEVIRSLQSPHDQVKFLDYPMSLQQHQACLMAVRSMEMQRLNDELQHDLENGGEPGVRARQTTTLQLASMMCRDMFGSMPELKKHVTLTQHRFLVYHAVSRAIQKGKATAPTATCKVDTMMRILDAVDTDDWSEATAEETKAYREKCRGQGQRLIMVSSFPDWPQPDL